MDYNVEDIDKILNFKTWSDNKKIDTLLVTTSVVVVQIWVKNLHKQKDKLQNQNQKNCTKLLAKLTQLLVNKYLIL